MLSIIIPTCNRKETIKKTLDHLVSTGELFNYTYEIIVVNDGSDELFEIENLYVKFNIRIIKNHGKKGAAAARNLGASLAIYDLLLFIDDDILLKEGSIRQIIDFHKTEPNCLMSGSREYSPEIIKKLSKSPFGKFMIQMGDSGMEGAEMKQLSENLYKCKTLASFCLSMQKSAFRMINGFDENFAYAGCEDQEFTMRALELDLKLYYLTSIKTYHNDLQTGQKDKWLNRQYTGVQGFTLLCELFPHRKLSSLYKENYRINSEDELKLKVKKVIKKFFYGKLGFYALKRFTRFLEKTFVLESILNKCYRLMGGMMIYQGFQVGQRNLHNFNRLQKSSRETKSY
jgi:GT2 family glycosyltransferase